MTKGEILARMSSHEISEWIAFANVEPFGEDRADLRAGIIASTIANANRDPDKRKKPFTPAEFMPDFEVKPEEKQQTWQDQKMIVEMLNAAFGGKDLRSNVNDSNSGGQASG